MPLTANSYCARSDLENILSAIGVTLRVDDVPPAILGDVIGMASDEVDVYCWQRYPPEALALSSVVTHWTAVIACAFLCIRRGNPMPPGIGIHYQRVMDLLAKVLTGALPVPYAPMRKSFVPTISVMRATMRPYPRAVVELSRSTGTPANYHVTRDPWDRAGANADSIMDYVI